MSAPALSEQTILLNVRCGCPGKPRTTVRLTAAGLGALRGVIDAAGSALDPTMVFETYYCRSCQRVVDITFRDLLLTS